MTLEQLIAQFRVDSEDKIQPYLFSDESITQWLNEAAEEACVRSLLLKDWVTAAVCTIPVTAGLSIYQPHQSIINITRAEFIVSGATEGVELHQTDEYELDRARPGWRRVSETPRDFIHHDNAIRFGCVPPDGVLQLEVNRLPLSPMASDMDEPEFSAIHHRHLVHWALYRAFSIPDAETLDQNKAAVADAMFTRIFGQRVDATTRREHQNSRPHHNQPCWMG
jgi:hypothetical protein